jgi:ATP phosphoribosyltransferase
VAGGTILQSEACFIANRAELARDASKLERTRRMLEAMEASIRARPFLSLTANVQGSSAESVARNVIAYGDVAGLQGPTIARVYPRIPEEGSEWFAVTVVVPKDRLQDAVDSLRRAGASDITAFQVSYVYESRAWSFEALLRSIEASSGARSSARAAHA